MLFRSYTSLAYGSSINVYESTFDRLRVSNDYQNTDHVTLTLGTNLERKERSWSLNIPRDVVKIKEITHTNIFTAGNLDSNQTFKKRIRDKYILVELDYYNTNSYKFVVPYINTKYRISHR